MARTGHINREDIYDVFGGPILVILYYINTILKAAICRKSTKVVKTDSIHYIRASTNLITTAIGRIKSQPCHITVIPCYNNIYIVLGDHFLLFRHRGL